jgi:transcriptional regulator with XRE-family HTH domain
MAWLASLQLVLAVPAKAFLGPAGLGDTGRMDRSAQLRDFLRSRRARLQPGDLGLPVRLDGRRTAGLRREEIAVAAGISVDYYTRLEQGRAGNVSAQVLDSLARALRLDELERSHLTTLVQPGRTRSAPPKATAAVRAMVTALDPTPALLHGPFLEVLGINRAGALLFADFDAMPVARRNLARWTFLDPRARIVYPQWPVVAAQMVAILRRAAGPHGDDPRLSALVAELTAASPDFARWWTDHQLFQHTYGVKIIHHESVGDMELNYQSLLLPQEPDQYIVVYTAAAGSAAAKQLELLIPGDRESTTAGSPSGRPPS